MRTITLARLARGRVALTATVAAVLTLGVGSASAANLITNGSFETRDFTGWLATNPTDSCPGVTDTWTVLKSPSSDWCYSGEFGFPTSISAEKGRFFADVTWDGKRRGPDAKLSQKVSIPRASTVKLSWWDNTSWDMSFVPRATLPRVEYLDILKGGHGSTVLHSYTIQTLEPGTAGNTGWVKRTLALSRYAGQKVRIRFRLTIPQSYTGPANFALDDVALRTG